MHKYKIPSILANISQKKGLVTTKKTQRRAFHNEDVSFKLNRLGFMRDSLQWPYFPYLPRMACWENLMSEEEQYQHTERSRDKEHGASHSKDWGPLPATK